MNKELEEIIENEFDCLINDLGCLIGEEWKAEAIKQVVNKAFVLGGVVKSFICHDADTYGKSAKCDKMCVNCRDFNK